VEDTVISDGECNYLLKADAEVQIPAGLCHLSDEVWGKHADAFNFRRFYRPVTQGDAARRVQPDPAEEAAQQELFRSRMQAFFPFGGGKHICLGRQYASVQILALVAPLIMGFDIKSGDGGFIERPEIVRSRLGEAVSRPSSEGMRMGGILIRREEWQGAVWKYVSDRNAER
jgi:cytochrome P450